jgi:steroid delta-isomerase-like uncharacterized protein
MSDDAKSIARRWFEEVWNQGRDETIEELLAPEAVAHNLNEPGEDVHGREGFKRHHDALRGAFPDLRTEVEDLIAEGDRVTVRWSARATHRGDHLGFPATGQPIAIRGTTILRVRDGRVVEGWDAWDRLSMLRQLGVVPPAGSK